MIERATRKVLMSPELMDQWATRDVDGNLLRWDWRQPNGEVWEPTVTTVRDDNLVVSERRRIAAAAEWLTLADAADDSKSTMYWDGWLAGIAAVLAIVEPTP